MGNQKSKITIKYIRANDYIDTRIPDESKKNWLYRKIGEYSGASTIFIDSALIFHFHELKHENKLTHWNLEKKDNNYYITCYFNR